MKIGVIGTGIVGRVISARLAGLGHAVVIGTREPSKTLTRTDKDGYGNPPFKDWYEQNKSSVRLGTFDEAAQNGEVIFNCTNGQGAVDALKQAGNANLKGKVIIDISNPLDFSKGFPPSLSVVNTDSLGEVIQRTFPDARVVKTLNTMNCFVMVNPSLIPGDHSVFLSGNDTGAKNAAKDILKSFGWKPTNIIDLGDITTARGSEQLLPIWVRLYGALQNPMFNFHIAVGPPPK